MWQSGRLPHVLRSCTQTSICPCMEEKSQTHTDSWRELLMRGHDLKKKLNYILPSLMHESTNLTFFLPWNPVHIEFVRNWIHSFTELPGVTMMAAVFTVSGTLTCHIGMYGALINLCGDSVDSTSLSDFFLRSHWTFVVDLFSDVHTLSNTTLDSSRRYTN